MTDVYGILNIYDAIAIDIAVSYVARLNIAALLGCIVNLLLVGEESLGYVTNLLREVVSNFLLPFRLVACFLQFKIFRLVESEG